MLDFWPACGWRHLVPDGQGRLPPSPAWLAQWLDRPELALVADSCRAETALHQALRSDPLRTVTAAELAALADADACENYRLFVALRDGVVAACTLEAFYSGLFHQGAIALPPLFIDAVVQTILRQLLAGDPRRQRAAHAGAVRTTRNGAGSWAWMSSRPPSSTTCTAARQWTNRGLPG